MSKYILVRERTRYFSVGQAADLFRVSERTILERIRKGEIKAIKIGRQWRIPDYVVYKIMTRNGS